VTPQAIIENLSIKNRAYNLLYALGQSPESVRTLDIDETYRLINLAKEVHEGQRDTYFHRLIAERVPAHQLRYMATGRVG
jgi:hypothetical protein